MNRLLLGALLLGHLGVTVQVPVTLAPPTHVRFDSVDYKNILHWTPPTNNTSLQYYVQWKIYGQPQWSDVDGCQGIQRHHCDLSDVTSELREWYYARVHADSAMPSSKSAWAISLRFSPRWDTIISPPVLKLNVTEQGIVVRVKSKQLVRKLHRSLQYKIYLIHPSGEEEAFEMDSSFNKRTLKDLDHKTKYCLQAQIMIPLQTRSSARSSVMCVTTL